PCLSPHQWVAQPRPVKLAKVALPTRAPPQPAGSPNSSRSPPSAIVSTSCANGDETRENAFWSSSAAVQSAASAAGVTPPVTKWKKRGPDEAVPAGVPRRRGGLP